MRVNVGIWTGAILLTIGLSVVLLVGEWFAAFDACLENPVCDPPGSLPTMEGYLGLMIGGVAIAVSGVTLLMMGLRTGTRTDEPDHR